jgi:hypothetical protein
MLYDDLANFFRDGKLAARAFREPSFYTAWGVNDKSL